ncbi:MAG: hypothetical protein HC927_10090 [Deltaproteobacteria bacterium]|nr:hypothetical protein [Deltaproteobacteria bacterium]
MPALVLAALAACADDGSNRGGNDEVGGIADVGTEGSSSGSGESGGGSEDGTASQSGSSESQPSDDSGGAEAAEDSGEEPADDAATKFDVGGVPDVGAANCQGTTGSPEFSNIWIANSPQGTVSKIDTFTAKEVARYRAGPMGLSDPSRTSVNLLGDVAVADRAGGVLKIVARLEDCVDKNDNGWIDTSNGPLDLMPWDADECVVWHLPLPSSGSRGPRPVAWEGALDNNDCIHDQPRLWIGHYHMSENKGMFYRLDGETGEILDQVEHPWSGMNWGPYGGAVDAEGNFWVLGWNAGPLIRIDSETLAIQAWATPPGQFMYGMTVDQNGDPWTAGSTGFHRFDTATHTWQSGMGGQSMRGIAAHSDGYIWIADPGGAVKVDLVTMAVVEDLTLPGVSSPVGVSVDLEGYVWLVDQAGSKAIKVDPDTHTIVAEVLGLVSPYTYSDMTGGGLSLVSGGPQG